MSSGDPERPFLRRGPSGPLAKNGSGGGGLGMGAVAASTSSNTVALTGSDQNFLEVVTTSDFDEMPFGGLPEGFTLDPDGCVLTYEGSQPIVVIARLTATVSIATVSPNLQYAAGISVRDDLNHVDATLAASIGKGAALASGAGNDDPTYVTQITSERMFALSSGQVFQPVLGFGGIEATTLSISALTLTFTYALAA
jgi:hypothetical protein